jgi:peptidoglycan/LPS O-acetylase OafA/YrhL
MPQTPPSAAPRYGALDALRGAAAVAVMLYHATGQVWHHTYVMHGYLAVDFFFLLSGFVIAHSYQNKLLAGMPPWQFLLRRVIRLQPLVIIGVLWGALVIGLLHHPDLHHMLKDILIGSTSAPVNPFPDLDGGWPFNSPIWSLYWEWLINIAFALILFRLPTWLMAPLSLAMLPLLVHAALKFHNTEMGPYVYGYWGGGIRVLYSFGLGMVLQRLATRLPWAPIRISFHWAIGLLILTLAFPIRVSPALDIAALAILFPATLLLGIAARPVSRFWLFCGEMSYPLYLIHQPFLVALDHAHLPHALQLLLSVTLPLPAAWFCLRYIDEPLRRWLTAQFGTSRLLGQLPHSKASIAL